MVKKLVLFDKIYNIRETDLERKYIQVSENYLKYLNERVKGFPNTKIKMKKLRKYDNRFEIIIDGPEEFFVSNLLKKEIGSINEFKDIDVGRVYKGTMVDIGQVGFGIFVDCAILEPEMDVLISLNTLREQLCGDKKLSLKDIVNTYEFIDHFPAMVKIIKIDREKNKIQGELDKHFLKLFNKICYENLEAVFVSGATKSQFKKSLIRSGHFTDFVSIERYGYLEHIVILKENTNAPGIISHIGKYLTNCKLSAIRSKRIKKILEN